MEKLVLLPCRTRMASLREETRRVDKTGLIRVDENFYKLAQIYAHKDVQVLVDDQTLTVIYNGEIIAELDKTRSVYRPVEQKAVCTASEMAPVPEAVYAANPLQRPLSLYQEAAGGTWNE